MDAKDELICEAIQPVKRGAYGSVDGIRQASSNRKAAREAVSAAAAANNYLSDAEMKAALAAIPTPGAPTPPPAAVVAGQSLASSRPKSGAALHRQPGLLPRAKAHQRRTLEWQIS